jgi:hypothetical protein
MASYEPYGFRHGGYRRRDANKGFLVIRARSCRPTKRTDRENDEMFHLMLGLQILSCFSDESPTLTSEAIGKRLDLPVKDVARAATQLMGLGYLAVELGSDENAWMLMPDDG